MTRAAIYARVSSAAQRDAHTIESQLRVLRAFVAQRGWQVAGEYIDDGRSAKTGKLERREGFARLLGDVAGFDVLVVVDVDRLTRTSDAIERAAILGPFQRAGIRIVTPAGGELDLDSFIGGLYVELQARFAAEENRKRAERIKAGKARAIAEGRKPAGPTPFGLAYDRASGTWSIAELAAATVREIYRRVIAGESCQAIADDLVDRGVPAPRGPWSRHKVWQLARSRHVYGTWTADKRTRATIAVPAILDRATFDAAQAALIEHGKRGLVKTKHVYLLEGLGVCGSCGQPIAIRSGTWTKDRRTRHWNPPAYICKGRKYEARGERCTAPILKVADVDARVWAKVEAVIRDPRTVDLLRQRLAERAADRRDWAADAKKYRTRLEQLTKAEAAILARFRRGQISDAAMDIETAAADRDRAAITAQLEAAEARARDSAPVVSAETLGAVLVELADSASPEARQRAVRALQTRAVFKGEDVALALAIDEPAAAKTPSLVVAAGYRMRHGIEAPKLLELRLVA